MYSSMIRCGNCRYRVWRLAAALGLPLFTVPLCTTATGAEADAAEYHPEPAPAAFEERESCYSMVWYYLSPDAARSRQLLQSLKDMGVTRSQALIYWWQAETLGGDYWKGSYQQHGIGEGYMRALDNYVHISRELGMKPGFRLGSFREHKGLWHPADKTGSVENYADWVGRVAARYRGMIDHYVIGDEENKAYHTWDYDGSAAQYFERMFLPLAKAIRAADPDAGISSCGASSSPATGWTLDLVKLGLPEHADGVACNLWHTRIEDLWEVEDMMREVREAWPEARFYANGVGYADNAGGLNDMHQAGVIAQAMFTLWDIGWHDAPYYLYSFSVTADTKQNFGIAKLGETLEFSYAWRAFQTIAQTFYDRDKLRAPGFPISLRQSQSVTTKEGTQFRIAPPAPVSRAFVRDDRQLLIYLAYRNSREPRHGYWDIVLDTGDWGLPQQIPLLDFTARDKLGWHREGGNLVVENVRVGLSPAVVTLRRKVR